MSGSYATQDPCLIALYGTNSTKHGQHSEGARVKGKIVRKVPPERPRIFPAALFAWLLFVSINFVCTLVLGLLSARFLPRYHQSVITTLREKPWASLGIGFVAAVVVPVVCALLFATIVAIPIGLILLAAFFILLYGRESTLSAELVNRSSLDCDRPRAVPRPWSWGCLSIISLPSFLWSAGSWFLL